MSDRGHDVYRLLVEHSTDVLLIVTTEGIIRYASPSVERVLGLTSGDLMGRSAFERVHPDDRAKVFAVFSDGLFHGTRKSAEYRYRHANGQWIHLESVGQPIVSGGVVTDAIINSRDVTDRVRALNELAASNAFRHALEDSMRAGLVAYDADGRIASVNRGFTQLTGWTADELLGASAPFPYWPADLVHARLAAFKRLVDGRRMSEPFEGDILKRDGTRLHVLTSPSEFEADDGRHILAMFYDLTEIQRLTAEVRQAQKLEAVGRLAGGVAHDFNNLLTAILGYTEFALKSPDDVPQLRNDLEQVRHAATSAVGLTRQLLAFSRKQELRLERVDVNRILIDVRKMLRRLIGEDVAIAFGLCDDPTPVMADPGQLEQVIMNLAVNARDAMPDGGRLVVQTARLGRDAFGVARWNLPAGDYCVIGVSDTGCGMTAEVRSHLFEPFFTTKPEGKGTGLGLATVHGIIHQSGGAIRTESAPGRGTSFWIFLPCTDAAPPQEPAAEKAAVPPQALQGERVLVVEDDESLRALTRGILERCGYVVDTAADGVEGLRVIDETDRSFDLVLTDVVMPNLGGPGLAQAIAARGSDAKVLFMSGYADAGDHALVGKAYELLMKPFTSVALAAKVRATLDAQYS